MNPNRSVLIRPGDVSPSSAEFEVVGTFNPGAIALDGVVHLLVRVAERPRKHRPGWVALPTFDESGQYQVEWVRDQAVTVLDARGVAFRHNGQHRLTTVSHLRLATSRDGLTIDSISAVPALTPATPYEVYGIEDPRITRLGDAFYITYVAVSRDGIVTALARTRDFHTFERLGVIFPAENKNVVLFPGRIGTRFLALHRPTARTPLSVPSIWLARSPDLLHWGDHQPLRVATLGDAFSRIGAGPPPIETPHGWLLIYHAVREAPDRRGPGLYEVRTLLLDHDDPSCVIRECAVPLLTGDPAAAPDNAFGGVLFPSGCVLRDGQCLIYAGEQDEQTIACVVPEDAEAFFEALIPDR